MNEKPKSKLSWRLLRWGLIGLAGLVTLVALLLTEENWRGKHAWENYKHAAEARGEKLDLASVNPPAVPDDQNFFCAPIVAEAWSCLSNNESEKAVKLDFFMNFQIWRGDSKIWPSNDGDWQKGKMTDLTEWQNYFRVFKGTPEGKTNGFPVPTQPQSPAADVLTALSVYDPALEQLREAAMRPEARMPLDYKGGFDAVGKLLPWLAETKRCTQFLRLRVLAELQDGRSAAALDDLKLNLHLIDSIRVPRFLISDLVRIAELHILMQPIYEGLAGRYWNDTQLAELEQELAREDMLTDYVASLKAEEVCAIQEIEKQRSTRRYISFEDRGDTMVAVTNSLRWMPSAFFFQNQLGVARVHDQLVGTLVNLTNRVISPTQINRLEAAFLPENQHYSLYKIEAAMTAPAFINCAKKTAYMQASVDLARTAIALERYRLAHGGYPETLAALAPQFIQELPDDVVNGELLHYRRTDGSPGQGAEKTSGKFVLWSVGLNEKDDNGTVVLTKSGLVDREKGDWVWKY